jgi:hypothetical protein
MAQIGSPHPPSGPIVKTPKPHPVIVNPSPPPPYRPK